MDVFEADVSALLQSAYLVVLGIWAPENLQSASVFLAAALFDLEL